jgi:hypothetical protein
MKDPLFLVNLLLNGIKTAATWHGSDRILTLMPFAELVLDLLGYRSSAKQNDEIISRLEKLKGLSENSEARTHDILEAIDSLHGLIIPYLKDKNLEEDAIQFMNQNVEFLIALSTLINSSLVDMIELKAADHHIFDYIHELRVDSKTLLFGKSRYNQVNLVKNKDKHGILNKIQISYEVDSSFPKISVNYNVKTHKDFYPNLSSYEQRPKREYDIELYSMTQKKSNWANFYS